MNHLDVDRVLSVLAGDGTADEHTHLEECARCRSALEAWRPRLAALRELESNAVETSEMHNLRVLYRQLGPVRAGRSWVARMTRGPELAAGPVRGDLAASFRAYSAGPYEIVLQVRPSKTDGRFDIQGQIADGDGAAPEGSSVVLTSPAGHADSANLDRFGEFRLAGVPAGLCRLVWLVGDSRIDLEELVVGKEDDGAGH